MSLKRSRLVILCLFFMPFLSFSQFYNTEVKAEINLDIQDQSFLQIAALSHNLTQIKRSFRYTLSIITADQTTNNKNNNKQEGRVVAEPGSKNTLATTAISINLNTRIIILLLLYDADNKIIGKDRKVLNGLEGEVDALPNIGKKSDQEIRNESSSFVLKGVVIEETKTKAGRDFYDLFYSSYLAKNINGGKVVKVEEFLAFGNNTQIKVFVENEEVVKFFVNPRSQYLKSMSDFSINKVNLYFQNLKNKKKQIIRY